jgi:hypothetical protein
LPEFLCLYSSGQCQTHYDQCISLSSFSSLSSFCLIACCFQNLGILLTGIPSLQSIHFPALLLFLFHLNLFFFDQALSRECSFELYCVSKSADFKNFFNSILGSLIYCFSNFWICCCYLLSISSLFFRIMGLGLSFLFMSDCEIILFSINSSHQFSYFVYLQT